jgi:hypothetical protein
LDIAPQTKIYVLIFEVCEFTPSGVARVASLQIKDKAAYIKP